MMAVAGAAVSAPDARVRFYPNMNVTTDTAQCIAAPTVRASAAATTVVEQLARTTARLAMYATKGIACVIRRVRQMKIVNSPSAALIMCVRMPIAGDYSAARIRFVEWSVELASRVTFAIRAYVLWVPGVDLLAPRVPNV